MEEVLRATGEEAAGLMVEVDAVDMGTDVLILKITLSYTAQFIYGISVFPTLSICLLKEMTNEHF